MLKLALYVLVVTSPTYGDSISEPMSYKACHQAMHEAGAEYDAFARSKEAALPDDLKDAEIDLAVKDIWNFKIHCVRTA